VPRPSRESEILDAALACFAQRGYDGTRVRHIAERAGVSEAALYRHHPSKEAVALALFATHMTRYAETLGAIAGDSDRTVEARVRAIVAASLDARREDPDAHAFVIGHQSRFLASLPADFPYPLRVVEGLVADGQRDGSVKPGPTRVLTALVLGCMNYPSIVAQLGRAGAIDLDDPEAAALIADGAWAAIAA
jgi:AcrR family transcriptional regulator